MTLYKIGAAILATIAALFYAFRKGAQNAEGKQARRDLKGVQKGIEGAGEARKDLKAGKSPEDIAKGSDGRW